MSLFKFSIQNPPTINALVVRGPKGEQGDTGLPGPSQITDQTDTDLTGILFGDGANVSSKSAIEARSYLDVLSQNETQSAITAALAAYTPTSNLAPVATSGSASDLLTGTLANARLSPQVVRSDFSYPDPSWVTSIAASKLTGTIPDARLSSNVPLKDAVSNAFTGNLTSPRIYVSGTNPQVSPSTSDGADNRTLILMGGGEFGPTTRGPHITLAGLEAATRPGNIELATGLNGEIRMGGELGGGFVETLRIVSAGKAQFRNATWHGSISDGLDRVLYALSSTTYYKGHGTGTIHEWRNGSDSAVMTLSQLGNLSINGSVQLGGSSGPLIKNTIGRFDFRNSGDTDFAGIAAADATFSNAVFANNGIKVAGNAGIQFASASPVPTSGSIPWLLYTANSNTLFLRDAINGRMTATFSVGANSPSTNVQLHSNLYVESGIYVAGGAGLVFASTTPAVIGGSHPWLIYTANSNALYLRDVTNARMHATLSPGATASAATATFHSRVVADDIVQVGTTSGPILRNNGGSLDVRNSGNSDWIRVNANEFRLNGLSYCRVAQLASGGIWGGGYNFNLNGDIANRDSTGAVNAVWYTASDIRWYSESSGAPGPITERMRLTPLALTMTGSISATGHITSAFQTLSADPTTLDITSGLNRLVKNTASGEIRNWVNDAGVMKKSPAYV